VVADSSKFARRGPVRLVGVDRIGCLITDDDAPVDALEALREAGVDVVTC
jgi:DeoR family transcriptional regulator of aga operon